jgi:hypothetical protein
MLQVLTAQIVASEREMAIQRRLQERANVRLALAAKAAEQATATPTSHDPAAHAAHRPCVACQAAGATIS